MWHANGVKVVIVDLENNLYNYMYLYKIPSLVISSGSVRALTKVDTQVNIT